MTCTLCLPCTSVSALLKAVLKILLIKNNNDQIRRGSAVFITDVKFTDNPYLLKMPVINRRGFVLYFINKKIFIAEVRKKNLSN